MNFLKSIFISTFPLLAIIGTGYSLMQLFEDGFSWQYLGLLLTSLPIVLFFALVFLNKKPRTDKNLMPYTPIIFLGTIITLVDFLESRNTTILIAAIVIAITWLLYLKWYSIFDNRANNEVLKIGQTLPNFKLEDPKSNVINSDNFKGNPSIYLFYRGNWCPLCMAQIKEIAGQYKALEEKGVNMILVSPQPHKNSAALANKFQVGFHFLVDKGNKVAQELNILAKNGLPFGFQALGYDSDTVLPTVVITDKKGRILFVDLTDNYRLRPEPSTFMKVLEEAGL